MNQIQVELQEWMGSDTSIANSAWTSTYDKSKREDKYDEPDKVANIVQRLITDGHGTPIESVVFRFWIRMPIFTDRQHCTHRIASHNGLSGRYRTMPNDWYEIPNDCVSILNKVNDPILGSLGKSIIANYDEICFLAYENYDRAIKWLKLAESDEQISNQEFKRVREVIRGMLPTAGMVERTTIINLRSFANYQRLRNSDHAQPEIRQVAKLMLQEVEKANICPVAIATLKEVGWRC